MATRNGSYQNRARIEWVYTVGSVGQSTTSVSVSVTAYLRMQSGASIAGNWPVTWSGSWGSSSNTQGITLSGGARQQIRTWTTTVSLTDSPQSRSFNIRVNHYHGATADTLSFSIPARFARTPTNLQVTRVSDGRLDLSWTRQGTYTSVDVQKQTDTGSGQVSTASNSVSGNASSYTSTAVAANRRYRWRVRGRNAGGPSAWTGWSGWVYTTPAAPGSVSAARVGAGIRVSLGSLPPFATHFDVYDQATGGIVGSNVTLASFPWTHTDPNPSVVHMYRVRSRRSSAGQSPTTLVSSYSSWSNTVQLIARPNAPVNLSPNGGNVAASAGARLSWQHNPVDSSDQTAFEVRYRPGTAGSWITQSGGSDEFVDVEFPAGSFQWQVRTKGAHADFSDWSAVATLTAISAPSVAVTQPATGTWTEPTVTVEWSFSQDDGRSQSAWAVELYADGSVVESRQGTGVTSSYRFSTRVERDQNYLVRVRAATGGVWSLWDEQPFTVAFIPPSAPLVDGGWDEETGSVGLTVTDGRGEVRPDIRNIYPNPNLTTVGGVTPLLVNGHPNPGARYGVTGFAQNGIGSVVQVDADWAFSGKAVQHTGAGANPFLSVEYGQWLDEFAEALNVATMVGETVTVVYDFEVTTSTTIGAPTHHDGSQVLPHTARSRDASQTFTAGVHRDWITFQVASFDSGFYNRQVRITGVLSGALNGVRVSNVNVYRGEYEASWQAFDGDMDAAEGIGYGWYGTPGESPSLAGLAFPKHLVPPTEAFMLMEDDGFYGSVAPGRHVFGLGGLDADTNGQYSVVVDVESSSPVTLQVRLRGNLSSTITVGESGEYRMRVKAGSSSQNELILETGEWGTVRFRRIGILEQPFTELDSPARNVFTNPRLEGSGEWVETRRNLFPNPVFRQSGYVGITGVGGGGNRTGGWVDVSDHPLGITTARSSTVTTAGSWHRIGGDFSLGDLQPGQMFHASGWAKLNRSGLQTRMQIQFKRANGTQIVETNGSSTSSPLNSWFEVSHSAVIPAEAVGGTLYVQYWTPAAQVGDVLLVTGIFGGSRGLGVSSFFAPGLPSPDPDMRVRFTGAENASPSVMEGELVEAFLPDSGVLIRSERDGAPAGRLIPLDAHSAATTLFIPPTEGEYTALSSFHWDTGQVLMEPPKVVLVSASDFAAAPVEVSGSSARVTLDGVTTVGLVGAITQDNSAADVWVTQLGLFEGDYEGEYADGDSPGWVWEGAPGNSASKQIDETHIPYFDGNTGSQTINNSSMIGTWDGTPGDSTSRLVMGEPTIRVEVERSIDGGQTWETVFIGDYDTEITITDYESLSYGETQYRVTGYSANDEPAETIHTVTADSDAIWLSTGETFESTARMPMNPDVEITRSRTRSIERYEGRTHGVAYASPHLHREAGFTAAVTDVPFDGIHSATRAELDTIVLAPYPVHLLRTPAGDRIYGECKPISYARIGTEVNGNTLWTASGGVEETER